MHELTFTHPNAELQPPLTVSVKPDQLVWAYGLNTARFPTYGGEVVQILSMYVDDLTITGTVGSYKELERIYGWFIQYMQLATQGHGGSQGYDAAPVQMTYHHRNWHFNILPNSLPAFRYGRDVVAPTWEMKAAVVEFSDNFTDAVMSVNGDLVEVAGEGGFEPFGTVTAEIGYNEFNPWSGPTDQVYISGKTRDQYASAATSDWFKNLIPSWLKGDFKSISADYSIPMPGINNSGDS
jgi:hypothetical protein